MPDLFDFDNCQKWWGALKKSPFYTFWLILPLGFVGLSVFLINENFKLRDQLTTIREDVAPIRELYPKLELSGAVAKLIEDQEVIKKRVDAGEAQREEEKWKRTAKFSQNCSFTGGLSFSDEPVITLMRSSMKPLGGGNYSIQCGGNVISNLEEVIRIEPTCPYPYFHLAYCYEELKDSRWKENAVKAKEIFEKTTSLPGHSPIHDNALKYIMDLLSKT